MGAMIERQTIIWWKEKLRQQFYPSLIEIRPLLRWVIFLELCYLAVLSGLFLGNAVSHHWHMPVSP